MFSKQSIKQFLKPNKKKILVFVILFIFFPVIFPWLSTSHCVRTETLLPIESVKVCEPQWTISYGFVFEGIVNETKRTSQRTVNLFEIKTLPVVWYPFYYIWHLFFSYLGCCIVVPFYSKIKPKKS